MKLEDVRGGLVNLPSVYIKITSFDADLVNRAYRAL